jgi:hypothetical protein
VPFETTPARLLKTSDDARRYVLAKLKTRADYHSWKHAAELLLDESPWPERIAKQIEYALFLDAELDVKFANDQLQK